MVPGFRLASTQFLAQLFIVLIGATFAATDTSAYKLEISPSDSWATERINRLLSSSADTANSVLATLPFYMQIRASHFVAWNGDSGILFGSERGKYPQLYSLKSPDAATRQMTFLTKRMTSVYPNPNPKNKELLYAHDSGGDENFHLAYLNLTNGKSTSLTIPPGRIEDVLWNDSGTAFLYAHTPTGTDRSDIRIHRTSGSDTLLLSLPGTWSPMDMSPDGKYVLVQKYVSAANAELFLLSMDDGNLSPLDPSGQHAFAGNAFFVPWPGRLKSDLPLPKAAGSSKHSDSIPWAVCFLSDKKGEFVRLFLTYPSKKPGSAGEAPGGEAPASETLVSETPENNAPVELSLKSNWDVEWVNVDIDRRFLVYSINEDGMSKLYALELSAKATGPVKSIPLSGIPSGLIDGVHFRPNTGRAHEFAFTVTGPTFPGEVFSYRMDRHQVQRWTKSETGGLPQEAFSTPQLIRFPTLDSFPSQIPAWLYKPAPKPRQSHLPVLILIHGGPESEARPGFEPFIQYAVGQLGIAVLQPNVRGSSGYGKSWLKADDGFKRMGSVHDIGALLDWIKTQPDLDTSRVAVAGRSYGGFMALSALIEYGPRTKNPLNPLQHERRVRLRGGISTVGITHFPTFLKKTSGYRRDLRRAEYGDERIPTMATFLDSISPLTRLDQLQAPLLLCHGRNDPRVPYQESETIAAALKAKSIPVWFLTFEQEGHAFRDQENQTIHYRVMTDFLTKVLDLNPGPGLIFRH